MQDHWFSVLTSGQYGPYAILMQLLACKCLSKSTMKTEHVVDVVRTALLASVDRLTVGATPYTFDTALGDNAGSSGKNLDPEPKMT
jgi:hypothetical protein